jgi:hypothetical protein
MDDQHRRQQWSVQVIYVDGQGGHVTLSVFTLANPRAIYGTIVDLQVGKISKPVEPIEAAETHAGVAPPLRSPAHSMQSAASTKSISQGKTGTLGATIFNQSNGSGLWWLPFPCTNANWQLHWRKPWSTWRS